MPQSAKADPKSSILSSLSLPSTPRQSGCRAFSIFLFNNKKVLREAGKFMFCDLMSCEACSATILADWFLFRKRCVQKLPFQRTVSFTMKPLNDVVAKCSISAWLICRRLFILHQKKETNYSLPICKARFHPTKNSAIGFLLQTVRFILYIDRMLYLCLRYLWLSLLWCGGDFGHFSAQLVIVMSSLQK